MTTAPQPSSVPHPAAAAAPAAAPAVTDPGGVARRPAIRPAARRRAPRAVAVAGVVLLAVTACTTGPAPDDGGSGSATPGTSAPAEEPPSELETVLRGPGEDLEQAAAEAVTGMDTAEKAGQVLVGQLGAAGTDPASLRELHLGGVIVMGDAVPAAGDGTHDVEALGTRLEQTQQALSAGRDYSGIVSVDQEGGLVARVKAPLTEWPTPMSYGAAAEGGELARAGHTAMGQDLAQLGFTVDFAPSVDVTIGTDDPAIGARSFSSDPQAAADLGAAATAGLLDAAVLPAVKHFPGHGSVTDDSHVTAPVQDASTQDLGDRDWRPFQQLLSGGDRYTPMVMMGHVIVPELEADVPSSVSAPAYDALRGLGTDQGGAPQDGAVQDSSGQDGSTPDSAAQDGTGGYDGVVVTDALNMGALVERYGADEAPVKALAAGADLLLMPSSVRGARDAIVAAVDAGEVPAERLDEAARRVVTMLMWRDELQAQLEDASAEELAAAGVPEGALDGQAVSRDVSAAAVTVVEGTCGEPLVEDSLQVVGGDATDRARLTAAAEAAGLSVGSGPVIALAGTARGGAQGDVVVALDAPFALAQSTVPRDGALIALYGRTPGAFEALVAVLTGQVPAPGALPVEVGQWPAGTGCEQ